MYRQFYNLTRKPFQISTDPEFLWLGEKHREALAVLRYGVLDNRGFLLMTGDVGTGKTTLINALVNSIGQEVIVAAIPDPGLELLDFLALVAHAFQMDTRISSKGDFLIRFKQFLEQTHARRKKVLLIIDEAQRLKQPLLEEIRLLSNLEKQSAKLINIFFVGQDEFNDIILEPRNRALRQRITVNFDLGPLNLKETDQYVRHRLAVAGTKKPIFNSGAIKEVYQYSKGYPRLINVICDRALVTGYVNEQHKINAAIVRECADELNFRHKRTQSSGAAALEKEETSAAVASHASHRRPQKARFLYVLLGLLIVAWLGIAAYFLAPGPVGRLLGLPAPSAEAPAEPAAPPPSEAAAVSDGRNRPEPVAMKVQPAEKAIDPAPPPLQDAAVFRILFNDANEISATGLRRLQLLANALPRYPDARLAVKGFSKQAGSFSYNQKIAEFSANEIKSFLVGRGVDPGRIETSGTFLVSPADKSAAEELKDAVRWVEVHVDLEN